MRSRVQAMFLEKWLRKKKPETPNQAKRAEFDRHHETTLDLGKQLREKRSQLDLILREINKNAKPS